MGIEKAGTGEENLAGLNPWVMLLSPHNSTCGMSAQLGRSVSVVASFYNFQKVAVSREYRNLLCPVPLFVSNVIILCPHISLRQPPVNEIVLTFVPNNGQPSWHLVSHVLSRSVFFGRARSAPASTLIYTF